MNININQDIRFHMGRFVETANNNTANNTRTHSSVALVVGLASRLIFLPRYVPRCVDVRTVDVRVPTVDVPTTDVRVDEHVRPTRTLGEQT